VLAATVAASAAYFIVPPAKYSAKGTLHVSSTPPRIVLQIKESIPEYGSYQRTQLAMLRSRLVLSAALREDSVNKLKSTMATPNFDPVEWLGKEISAEFVNGSEVLQVGMSGDNPAELQALVNAVIKAYMAEVVDFETKQRRDRYETIKSNLTTYEEKLKEKRKELRQLTETVGSDDKKTLATIQQHELERLGRAEEELGRVRTELRAAQVEYEVLTGAEVSSASPVTLAMVQAEVERDQTIEALVERVAKARKGMEDAARFARSPSDQAILKHQRDWQSALATLAEKRKRLYPIIERQLKERLSSDRGSEIALLSSRIKVLEKIERVDAAEVKRLEANGRQIGRAAVDVSSIQEEIRTAEDVARTLAAEVEALNVELQAPPRIRVLEEAELPRTKDELRPLRTAGLAGGAAFVLTLAAVSFVEFRSRRVDNEDEVVRGLGVKLVGALPLLPSGGRPLDPDDPRSQKWQSLLAESVDAARTAVLHAGRTESVRVVMVASALGGEGKTSLACHLASSLARAGRQTLLVDGDLRCPTAHLLFDSDQEPGLCDVLRGEAEWGHVVRPTAVNRLSLIPAGLSDIDAIQALADEGFWRSFAALRERYDFIVVDSPPVLPVADALLIGQHVDGVILSVMRGVSRLPKLHTAYERMSALGIRVLGAAVTGARGDTYRSEYRYSGRYVSRPREQT
jgi:capsular exopolysaccharide synthesis family protein